MSEPSCSRRWRDGGYEAEATDPPEDVTQPQQSEPSQPLQRRSLEDRMTSVEQSVITIRTEF